MCVAPCWGTYSRSRHRARRIGERVDEVELDGEVREHLPKAVDRRADDGHDPVDLRLRRPTVPQQTDRDEQRAKDERRDAILGLADAVVQLV